MTADTRSHRGESLSAVAGANDTEKRQAIDEQPEALCSIGQQRFQQGQNDEAERLYLKAIELQPRLVCAHLNLGELQLSEKQWDPALTSFETVLKMVPGTQPAEQGEVAAASGAALAARKSADMDGALGYLVRARAVVPRSSTLLRYLGVQELDMHLYKDSEQTLLEARHLDPDDMAALYALARAQLQQQKISLAESNLRTYLIQRPGDASAHYGLGHILYMYLRLDEARFELERSIALQPLQTESYYELGQIELDQRHDDQASPLFNKALERNALHGGALTGLGVIAYRRKEYEVAEDYLKKAAANAPDYRAARYYYGMTLLHLGKKEEAAVELAVAQKLARQENTTERGGMQLATPPQ